MTHPFKTAIGLMSGTSLDGIDAAIIRTNGARIESMGASCSIPYDAPLRERIRHAIVHGGDMAKLAIDITQKHVDAVQHLLDKAGLTAGDIDLLGFHGQTIKHDPAHGITVQIGDGALLAKLTGIDVVYDMRTNDVRHGGQGAPLVPLFHAALAGEQALPVAIVNIGGVANVTYIDEEGIIAFDTGPGNALIDDWIFCHNLGTYDAGGTIAAQGAVDAQLLNHLLDHPYFAKKPPKSLDRNEFVTHEVASMSLEDGAATLSAFTIQSIAKAARHFPTVPKKWFISGGGRHNLYIMNGLKQLIGSHVKPVEVLGCDGDMVEAQAFGFLAVRSLYGLPLTLPSTTGVSEPLTGGVLCETPA